MKNKKLQISLSEYMYEVLLKESEKTGISVNRLVVMYMCEAMNKKVVSQGGSL